MQPILKIDLTSQEISRYEIPVEWQRDFLGGGSLAARILYPYLTPQLDPLSPEAPLLFLNGPLSGTSGPAVGRFSVAARSPHTGLWGESNCGGFWGPELRMAGFDGLWLTGRAEVPVYVWIRDGRVEIRPAEHLWGLDTYQTQAAVEAELAAGKHRLATIGLAGEAQIPYALILTDHGRVAGRTGMGAVMGSKNVKALAVQGHGEVPLVSPEIYKGLRSEANRQLRNDSMTQVLRSLGTAGAAEYFDYLGEMPKRYFQNELYENASRISGASIAETILVGVSACQACVIACGRVVHLPESEGAQPDTKRKGPEYETLVGFGPNLLISDTHFITRMGELCDRYGMDSISLSNTIGLAFWLFDLGIISEKDTGGLALRWGDQAVVEKLVHLAARRQGFGAYLAQGARALGKHFGAEAEAVQVNGLEAAYHDPRGSSGMALVYATSPIGASHNQSDYFFVDLGQVEPSLGLEYFSHKAGVEKAANVAKHQDWRTVFNALVLCLFSNVSPEMVLDLVNAACGLDWKLPDLMRSGERAWNLKRAINHRLGLTRANDTLPKAMLRPYSDAIGGKEGFVPDFSPMLEAYYAARGWDPATGRPTKQKLAELGLEWLIPDLWGDSR
jgi:aldehyde:ferredoxin oxidoreductase